MTNENNSDRSIWVHREADLFSSKKSDYRFNIAGRSEEKLLLLKSDNENINAAWVGDITNQEFIERLLSNSEIIVNCAGPFTEESSMFLSAVAESGCTYLDISGEVGFIKSSKENHHHAAIKSEALIVHACAFESLIADLAAQLLIQNENLKELNTYYWFNQKKVSPGTKMTMKLSKFRETLKIKNGTWDEFDFSSDKRALSLENNDFVSVPYPLPEIAFFSWNGKANGISSSLLLAPEEAKYIGHTQTINSSSSETLEKLKRVKKDGPTKDERADHIGKIILEGIDANGNSDQHVITNKDMYGTTAQAITLAIMAIGNFETKLTGVISPAKLFTGKEKETLELLNCTIRTEKIKIEKC